MAMSLQLSVHCPEVSADPAGIPVVEAGAGVPAAVAESPRL